MKFIKKIRNEKELVKVSNELFDAINNSYCLKWENFYHITNKYIGLMLLCDKDIRRLYDVNRGMFYWEVENFVRIYEFDDYNHECVKLF